MKTKIKKEYITYSFIPIIIGCMIKYTKKNHLKYNQTCKKRWCRQIFNYLRNDKDMIENIEDDKVYFYKKGKDNVRLYGIENLSKININTSIPILQEYCNDKKKFCYVVSSDYIPTTIFIDDYGLIEKQKKFIQYKMNNENYLENIIDTVNIQKNIISNKIISDDHRIIKKPIIGSQGEGIKIIDNLRDYLSQNKLDENFIYQEEIKPKLYKGYKFDIRYFAVIIFTKNKVEIKHIPFAMVRLCSKKFSLQKEDVYSNLTNTSINKNPKCTLSISKNDIEWGKYFKDFEIITEDFFNNIFDIHNREEICELENNKIASTRILGFDFMISEDNKVYILEANYCPGDNIYYGAECKEKVIKYYSEEIIKKLI